MMFLLAVALLVVGIGAFFVRTVPRHVPPIALVVAVGLAVASTIIIVPAGQVGVTVLFGKVQDGHYPEGLHLVNPLVSVVTMSVRVQAYTMSSAYGEGQRKESDAIDVKASDGLEMKLDVTVLYRLVAADAPGVYRSLGEQSQYEDKIIRSSARTSIREAASQFTSQEAYGSERTELAKKMAEMLTQRIGDQIKRDKRIKGAGFEIQQVMLRNVELPARVRDAIEEKLAAEQDAERMKFLILKETQEADRKKIEAGGIAEAAKLVSDISDKYLQLKGIEATLDLAVSPNAKFLIIGGGKGGLPVILNTAAEK
jgi:regulator of protease activity HflC (stomatin/prohibitin superfamily)